MNDTKKIFAISGLCTGCRTCEVACAVAHSKSNTIWGAITELPAPRYRIEIQTVGEVKLPLNCRQCDEPDCLFACKAGAVSKDPEDGQVKLNLDKCVGCWMCVMVCPFGAVTPDEGSSKALKCDLCEGRSEGPACVSSCPTHALIYGTIDNARAYLKNLGNKGIVIKSA
ncbi:4Fe-4S ferredoxin [candidate division LCP-89 bacterium B3_LCP]|uniref:4Fe-4S ferredoxin n=1 Tax=candidate division LCP-89 bacterium B3_LCP TaxID=2012998 RepID=A0A532UPJ8_UNCL8|nr:MAG: 4Fe-4S ferredoxin [candidate division LCP-89 bacterium B3_LCP]